MTSALEVRNLTKLFGVLCVTGDVSFTLEPGARAALIGPNGAGKTTLVNLIAGALKPNSGHIALYGDDLTSLSQAKRVHSGLVRTFQVTKLFSNLTVEENIQIAVVQHQRRSFSLFTKAQHLANVGVAVEHALESLRLNDRAHRRVRDLAYGEQRLVEISLALALHPKVLLLDEPAAGVPESESSVVMEAIGNLSDEISILFIEHDMDLVFRFASRILVLVAGSLLMDDTPEAVANDERVRRLYLGEDGYGTH
jgi:branched-chain amino acid transport system ATP-binding protein